MPSCHRHIMVNARVARIPSIDECRIWLDELVSLVEMNTLVPATCVPCTDTGNEGITGTVVISTSHAAFHYWSPESSEPRRLSFCLYSCAPFDPKVVLDYIHEFWSTEDCRYRLLDRSWEIDDLDMPIWLGN